jgi:hypothetical protein
MSTRKRKRIGKAAPVLSAAAAAGLLSVMGTAMAAGTSAKPVSQIVLASDGDPIQHHPIALRGKGAPGAGHYHHGRG